MERLGAFSIGIMISFAVIFMLHQILPPVLADVFLGSSTSTYPWTIQNLTWIVFWIGAGELGIRLRAGKREFAELRKAYLPEDRKTLLRMTDVGTIYKRVRENVEFDRRFLPRLIARIVLQFQSSRSVDQANALLNSSLDLHQHEIDLRYSLVKYIAWLIPTLGFLGTIIGISLALSFAGNADLNDPALLSETTQRLSVAFYTTLLALLLAALLMFFVDIVQTIEERALNHAGQYCLDNLINRLYEK